MIIKLFAVLIAGGCIAPSLAGEETAGSRRTDQEALKAYGGLVGGWRGAGLRERGSARGAWTEQAEWVWKLDKASAALELKVEKGKYLKSAILSPGKTAGEFKLMAMLSDGGKRTFVGKKLKDDAIEFRADEAAAEGPARITLTPLHDTRFLLLLEAAGPAAGRYVRLGEVGYTRKGVQFAAGDAYPKCVVTDGRGTIKVSYKGETYYVCCSGCKDLFDERPGEIIAEAAERAKKVKKPEE